MVITLPPVPLTELCVCGTYKVKVPSQQSGTRTHAVYGARFILQGIGLVTASLDRTLNHWDPGNPDTTCLRTLEGHNVRPAGRQHNAVPDIV